MGFIWVSIVLLLQDFEMAIHLILVLSKLVLPLQAFYQSFLLHGFGIYLMVLALLIL
jgi:hypothetical protein